MAEKVYKFPKEMGSCADLLYTLRERRLAGARAVAEAEAEEKALKKYIIDNLPKSKASGVSGKLATVTVKNKTIWQVEDWAKFYGYIKKTGSFDLLNKAVNQTTADALHEAGKKVPGMKEFETPTVSCTKV